MPLSFMPHRIEARFRLIASRTATPVTILQFAMKHLLFCCPEFPLGQHSGECYGLRNLPEIRRNLVARWLKKDFFRPGDYARAFPGVSPMHEKWR